jgi:hypothetical protein
MSSPRRQFLDRYERLLRPRVSSARLRRRILAEAEEHLLDCAETLQRDGMPGDEAERIAVVRFGPAEMLAMNWQLEPPSPARWTIASTLGITGGLIVTLAIGPALDPFLAMMLTLPLAGLVVGSGLGVGQWLSLRSGFRWVVMTGLAAALGLTASTVLVETSGLQGRSFSDDLAALALIGSCTGAIVGLMQSLSSAVARRNAWWIRSAAGAAIGCMAGGSAAMVLFGGLRTSAGMLLVAAAAGLFMATFTAPLTHPRPS